MNQDLNKIREELLKQTIKKVKEAYSSKEIHIIKSINLIEELDEMFNVLTEHCIDWFGYHFPELFYLISNNETYLQCILLGERKNLTKKALTELNLDKETIQKILEKTNNSIGSDFNQEELKQLQDLAKHTLDLKETRKNLTGFVEKSMKELAPNFSELCGSILGARFLAKTGSLQKLASFPSSTLQVLGAEKALFAHLKTGSKSPKYGYLYSHPLVKQAKHSIKGRMARHLAGKLSIALRTDVFGEKKLIAKKLLKECEKRLTELNAMEIKPKKEYKQKRKHARKYEQKHEKKIK